jgi:hypothetical protein
MSDAAILDTARTRLEFGVASLATQAQAVDNLFSADQAQRIRAHVLRFVSASGIGQGAIEGYRDYAAAWERANEAREAPFDYLAAACCERLEIRPSHVGSAGGYVDPLFVTVLAVALSAAIPGWWKNLLGDYRVVP